LIRALLFPGQGSQYVGMGQAIAQTPKGQLLLEEASSVLGFDMAKLLSEGPEERLKATENTQPALFTVSLMVYAALLENEVPFHAVLGHSLGEYSALCAAGVFSFADGLKLVRIRGELMASAGVRRPGAMAAVLGLEAPVLTQLLSQAQGTVVIANLNSPGQLVISGEKEAVGLASELAAAQGAKKVVPLPVSGAFHSPLMEFALEGLSSALDSVVFQTPKVPVITNVDALPCTQPEQLRESLKRQLISPVRWIDSIEKIKEMGATEALEVGSGKVLMGLCRGISRDLKVSPMESPEDFQKWKASAN